MKYSSMALLVLFSASPAVSQSFSCNYGTRPACLDIGDKVCSALGKCVDQFAECFNRRQCDSEGFTCKSNVTDCIRTYDDLQYRFNDLVGKHNELIDDYENLTEQYNSLRRKYTELLSVAKELEQSRETERNCVWLASDLKEAQNCL